MLWNQVLVETLETTDKKMKFKEPLRFQLPDAFCSAGLDEWGRVSLDVSWEFIEWYRRLESHVCTQTPWSSALDGNTFTVKIDSTTLFFDSNRIPTGQTKLQGCMIKCIVEISGVYFFRQTYGFTLRISQIMALDYLFSSGTDGSCVGSDEDHA